MFPGYLDLQPGTMISAPTHLIYRHYGIVTDRGMVLSCSARVGHGAEETVDVFCGSKGWRIEPRPSELPWWVVLQRARELTARPYHVTDWNCESYVNASYGLPPRSQQAEMTALAIGFGCLALVASQM